MPTIETILTRMMNDSAFADTVFVNAASALGEYDLTPEDLAQFKRISRAQFDEMQADQRKSMMGLSMGQPVKDWING